MSNLTDLLRGSTTIQIFKYAVDATASQTIFTGLPDYEADHIAVFIDGVRQINTAGNTAYTEVPPNQVTLATGVPVNTQVEFVITNDLAGIDDSALWELDGNDDLTPKD